MLTTSLFSPVEHAFAESLLSPFPSAAEASLLIKILLYLSRQGHLCLKLSDEEIYPELTSLFGSDIHVKLLKEALLFSAKVLPAELCQEVQNPAELLSKPICKFKDCYYLQRFFLAETAVLKHWQRINQTEPNLELDPSLIQSHLQTLQIEPEQLTAINKGLKKSLVILTGGPGTGKTFTAAQMIKVFLNSLPTGKKVEIAIAAPTGKAASHLEKSLKALLGETTSIVGKTIHSLTSSKTLLSCDLLLVDESSMIDVELMAKLLGCIKEGARLILIGDKDQLPPVEAGSIFADLTAVHPHTVSLKKCMRAELKTLVEFAKEINLGHSLNALHLLKSHPQSLERVEPSAKGFKTWLQEMANFFPTPTDPEAALQEFNRFRLLSPLRQGPYGVEEINRVFLNACKKRAPFLAPIMIKTNDAKKELFNGEIGVLVKTGDPFAPFTPDDYALFSQGRKCQALLLPTFEYAYCLSVHKSQGSEFDHVVLLLQEGAEVFGRKVVYTAVTRAKKKLTIYGTEEMLARVLAKNPERYSSLQTHLASTLTSFSQNWGFQHNICESGKETGSVAAQQ